MKRKLLVVLLILSLTCQLAACSGSQTSNTDTADNISSTVAPTPTPEPASQIVTTAVKMQKQGNPTSIMLSDIAEVSGDKVNAWIKISTKYDEVLSMYNYDSLAAGTLGIAVTFTVEQFDCTSSTLYWCYQLTSGGVSTSIWDNSSLSDTLTITKDGTYRLFFDAKTALGGTLDEIDSFQIVFPCGSEVTSTKFTVKSVECITVEEELQYFKTGCFNSDGAFEPSAQQPDTKSYESQSVATKTQTITISSAGTLTDENKVYDGLGFISANNSSRLLLDYKSENPAAYWEILENTFGSSGMKLNLIKIEMGADVDSSSGTEPAVKRYADEIADVTRGAGYQLAADAISINPDVQVDLLYWGIPAWIANEEGTARYEALYKWYKETIDALYDTYNIKVSYVTVTQNERNADKDWIKYFSAAIKAETDERYDYDTIKIIAGEGVSVWNIANSMLKDSELMDAIDIVSAHYC